MIIGVGVVIAPSIGQEEPRFTEFYILSENQSDDLVMRDYLSSSEPIETTRIWAGITNREYREVNYTVIVQVQRVKIANKSLEVLERERINKLSVNLSHNESTSLPYDFTVNRTETGCRIAFLLYTGAAPGSPTIENSYRELHVWNMEDPPGKQPNCRNISAVNVELNQSYAEQT
jgi:uncharacterized membrane protein